MKIQKLFSLTIVALAFTVFAQGAQAGVGSYGQNGQYGQGPYGTGTATPAQSLIVEKAVSNGATTKGGSPFYVDNFAPTDPKFTPGQRVYFQIKVKNATNVKLTNVVVTDFVPNYVVPVEGPGSYDAASRKITYTLPELNPGQEDVKYFLMQVVDQAQLPTNKGVMELVNRATATSGSLSDDDTAKFYVEKQVVGVQKSPAAGPEMGLAVVALQFAGLGAGIYLKRKSA